MGFSSAVLAGGTLFIVLSCAGYAAEVLYPATLLRFESFAPGAQPAFTSLVLSAWLYHFCQAGAAVMVTIKRIAIRSPRELLYPTAIEIGSISLCPATHMPAKSRL